MTSSPAFMARCECSGELCAQRGIVHRIVRKTSLEMQEGVDTTKNEKGESIVLYSTPPVRMYGSFVMIITH